MSAVSDPRAVLRSFRKSRDFFIGIDSDGCAFDTMEVKHKECFIPNTVRAYGLAAVARVAREAWEFVNLYSRRRGINRFPGLTGTMDLLASHPEVRRRGFSVPELTDLKRWIAGGTTHSNATLRETLANAPSAELEVAFSWSEAVNRSIGETVRNVPPFPCVREALEGMVSVADVMVVSATPGEALEREWREHDLSRHVGLIAGQEHGSKREQLALATRGRYEPTRVLMVGDAPGDREAAESNNVLFYPIEPGREEESWRRFRDEALPRFFDGTYAGPYMAERIARFDALLPEVPPWQSS